MEGYINSFSIEQLHALVDAGMHSNSDQKLLEKKLVELYAEGVDSPYVEEEDLDDSNSYETRMDVEDDVSNQFGGIYDPMNDSFWIELLKPRPILKKVSERKRYVKSFDNFGKEFKFTVTNANKFFGYKIEILEAIFKELLDKVSNSILSSDYVSVKISFGGLDDSVYPFTRRDQLIAEKFLNFFNRGVLSNVKFSLNTIDITVTSVCLLSSNDMLNINDFIQRKKCIIKVSDENNLSFGRSLALGLEILNKNKFRILKKSRKLLTNNAVKMYKKARVPLGSVTFKDYPLFQKALPFHQIIIYEMGEFIYRGKKTDKQIFLLRNENRYYLIKSITAFLSVKYFCTKCFGGYDLKTKHKCFYNHDYPNYKYTQPPNRSAFNTVFCSQPQYDNHRNSLMQNMNHEPSLLL